jgi:hypothetical protein
MASEIDLAPLEQEFLRPPRTDVTMELILKGKTVNLMPLFKLVSECLNSGNVVKDHRSIELLDREFKINRQYLDQQHLDDRIYLTEFALRGFFISAVNIDADLPYGSELRITFTVDVFSLKFNKQPSGENNG